MIKKIKNSKIRTQFIFLILCAGTISFILFECLWTNKWTIAIALTGIDFSHTQQTDLNFMDAFYEAAERCDIPASEDDTEAVAALEPFLNMPDQYTSIYIYGMEDGLYRAGRYAPIMDHAGFRTLFDLGYAITNGDGEEHNVIPMKFRNGTALVMIYNYQRFIFSFPYLIGTLLLCIILFLCIVLFFLNRKMHSVLMLKTEILIMASGDLTHQIPELGEDEIGILAKELDNLRGSLRETILKEQESRKANQDLITALSHDLRTPLTILNGYLEILRLKRSHGMQEEYLEKCLKKSEDIKELTDKMFEYALVSEEYETPEMTWISTDFIEQCLAENCDFIRLAGFNPSLLTHTDAGVLESDKMMLKRIFNNLFSNILKYGDKKYPVTVKGEIHKQFFTISLSNTVKQEHFREKSNNIGLKNVQTMTALLNGTISVDTKDHLFTTELRFPLR